MASAGVQSKHCLNLASPLLHPDGMPSHSTPQVLQEDGSVLPCALNAACAALVDAGVPLSTMFGGWGNDAGGRGGYNVWWVGLTGRRSVWQVILYSSVDQCACLVHVCRSATRMVGGVGFSGAGSSASGASCGVRSWGGWASGCAAAKVDNGTALQDPSGTVTWP